MLDADGNVTDDIGEDEAASLNMEEAFEKALKEGYPTRYFRRKWRAFGYFYSIESNRVSTKKLKQQPTERWSNVFLAFRKSILSRNKETMKQLPPFNPSSAMDVYMSTKKAIGVDYVRK